jgi:hypothetical protein
MFERLYHSPLHNPGAYWLIGLPLLVFFALRLRRIPHHERRFFLGFTVVFQLVILLDAALQGELSPLDGAVKTGVSIAFVILGDLRFFVLIERFGRIPPAPLWSPVILSLGVPVASTIARPFLGEEPRVLFLVYELAFAGVALAILLFVLPRRRLEPPWARWARGLALYELAQYLGWATADVVILSGHDAGHLLRVLPNAMYYAGFIPFAWFSAPRQLRS